MQLKQHSGNIYHHHCHSERLPENGRMDRWRPARPAQLRPFQKERLDSMQQTNEKRIKSRLGCQTLSSKCSFSRSQVSHCPWWVNCRNACSMPLSEAERGTTTRILAVAASRYTACITVRNINGRTYHRQCHLPQRKVTYGSCPQSPRWLLQCSCSAVIHPKVQR